MAIQRLGSKGRNPGSFGDGEHRAHIRTGAFELASGNKTFDAQFEEGEPVGVVVSHRQRGRRHVDRLRMLAEELWEQGLEPALRPEAGELIQRSRAQGLRQVLVTGAFDLAVAPLVRELGFDDCGANRLDLADGRATGHLVPPVMAGAAKAGWIRAYAEREGLSLGSSYAYADSLSDLPMLSVVGRPTAVNPDAGLRRVAREQGWPVLWLS